MKQTSTQRVRVPFKMCLVLFLTISSLMFSKTSSAHTVVYFIPPCISVGTAATIGASITSADANTWYHWQYRINVAGSAPGAWQWINGVANGAATNTTINGTVFAIQNANRKSGTANTVIGLIINSPTTALNNVELRLLMSDNEDPNGANGGIWGGNISAPTEGKGIRLMVKPATESCYANCTNNRLVTDPANPTLATYWGGFEAAAAVNFGATTGSFNASATAQRDLTAAEYGVLNNPYVLDNTFTPFAPHSGKQMMVVSDNDNSQRTWYRTIVVSNASNFYQNTMSFKAWFSKVTLANSPTIIIEVKGATTQNGTPSTVVGSQTYAFPAAKTPGDWQQVSLDLTIPVHTYKKLTISIRTTTNNSNFAVDDLCFLEPASGLLPIIMTPLKGTYSNGVSRLTWSTLQESNSSHFDIERSSDGVNFTSIGKVYAKGFSDRATEYAFNDVKVNAGTNYYRLRAVDKDADFKNSNIVALEVKIKGTNVTGIFPNPFVEKVNVAVSSEINGQAVIRLFDNTGRMIASQQSTISKGVNNVTINNLAGLAKGIYMVKVEIGDVVVTQKLIK